MKKVVHLCILILLLSCLIGCNKQDKQQYQNIMEYAKRCYAETEINGNYPRIYVMKYTEKSALAEQIMQAPMSAEIPDCGYLLMLHSIAFEPYEDTWATFFDENGRFEYIFDYELANGMYRLTQAQADYHHDSSKSEEAKAYKTDCTLISGMVDYADRRAIDLNTDIKENTWYVLTDEQFTEIRSKN